MKKFGSIDAVMRADTDDLAKAEGIGKELAEKIKKHFEEL